MSNACCVSRICALPHSAAVSLSVTRRHVSHPLKRFSSSCGSSTMAGSPPIIISPSSWILSAQLSQSDTPQRSEEWFALRRDRLTTSSFSTALGFWKRTRRAELWQEKVFPQDPQSQESRMNNAMEWGMTNEAVAIERYKSITGQDVGLLGFAVHSKERFDWLGASPDGLLGCFQDGGILEVKCPYNNGKPKLGLPWSSMPFYYMPQIQGLMEIMDREWVDLYCWTLNGSTIFRVYRVREYWELIHGVLHEFWWGNVIPAREALSLGKEEEAWTYKPESTHRRTGQVIAISSRLASEAKLLCRELAGQIEFFT
ncbi:hypothetical protein Droror1_Dr00008074 [Drosera rotundifolia]